MQIVLSDYVYLSGVNITLTQFRLYTRVADEYSVYK